MVASNSILFPKGTRKPDGRVLVHGALGVPNERQVLDYNVVVGLLGPFGEQDAVGSNHIIHDVAFGDLLGAELLRGAQVEAVVVAKVVVGSDALRLDPGPNKELNKRRLHLRLARLEVITRMNTLWRSASSTRPGTKVFC